VPLRILSLGQVGADLEACLRQVSAGEALEAVAIPAALQDAAACLRLLEPDLVLVGEQSPWSCRELTEAARDPRLLVPLLSTTGEDEADLDLRRDGRDAAAVMRAALRLARLRRVARAEGAPTLGAEATQGLRRLSAEFTRAVRYRHPLAVVVLVLDGAEDFRGTYGLDAVEGFAAALSQALADTLRTADFLFRAGDLEWVVGLPETPAAGARVVAQRLRTRTRALVHKSPAVAASDGRPALPLKATASVGVADGPGPGIGSAADLLTRARQATAAARRSGGDRVVFDGAPADPDPARA
jgi:diguanylate cyclase (GGDEF)-like protein